MPYIVVRRSDIPAGAVQITDLYFNFVCFDTLDDKLDGANLHSDVRDQKRVGHLSLF